MIVSLIEPFQFDFFVRSLLAATIVGAVCSVIGVYVVVRSMAFLGDALAHAVLPGVAIAYLFGGNLTIGALAASCLVALGVAELSTPPCAYRSGPPSVEWEPPSTSNSLDRKSVV